MKCSVFPGMAIGSIPKDIDEIHLVRPVKASLLGQIIEKRKIGKVSCSKSTFARLRKKHKRLLEEKGIGLVVENAAGRPIGIGMQKMLSVAEMVRDHRSYREIERTLGVPKSTVHYFAKTAQRAKIKSIGKILHLQQQYT
jgi:hypothetical protein